MLIRPETPSDIPAIRRIVTEAFRLLPESSGTEAAPGAGNAAPRASCR